MVFLLGLAKQDAVLRQSEGKSMMVVILDSCWRPDAPIQESLEYTAGTN